MLKRPAAIASALIFSAAVLMILWKGGYLGDSDNSADAPTDSRPPVWPPGIPQIMTVEVEGERRSLDGLARIQVGSPRAILHFEDVVPALYSIILNGTQAPFTSNRTGVTLDPLREGENKVRIQPSGRDLVIVYTP